jgi:hypothetical protein
MQLRLPHHKLVELCAALGEFTTRKRASKSNYNPSLGSLTGLPQWFMAEKCSYAVTIINAFCKLKHKTHKIRLSHDVLADIT